MDFRDMLGVEYPGGVIAGPTGFACRAASWRPRRVTHLGVAMGLAVLALHVVPQRAPRALH